MPRAGRVLKDIVDRAEEVLIVGLMALVVFVAFADVVVRNVGLPLSRVQQLLPNLFVWVVWLGIPYGIRREEHFRVRALPAALGERYALVLRWLTAAVATSFFCLTTWFGVLTLVLDIRAGSTTPTGFPAAFLDAAVPVGSILAIVRTLQHVLSSDTSERPAKGAAD